MPALTPNGHVAHQEFPTQPYEAVHTLVTSRWSTEASYFHYSGAWNALAYRFHGAVDAGTKFQKSLRDFGSHPAPHQQFHQEEALFNFFSNGFAAFEAMFYALFAVGHFIDPLAFPLTTPMEQQRVSPSHTADAFKRAFPNEPLLDAFASLFTDTSYQRWRDMRNVLTHRAAAGRRVYVGVTTVKPESTVSAHFFADWLRTPHTRSHNRWRSGTARRDKPHLCRAALVFVLLRSEGLPFR